MAKRIKTGGRKAGTPNKATAEGREFVERVQEGLKKKHKLTLEEVSVALLGPEAPAAVRQRELQNLREYGYGKSVQPLVSGEEDGKPVFIFEATGGVRRGTK